MLSLYNGFSKVGPSGDSPVQNHKSPIIPEIYRSCNSFYTAFFFLIIKSTTCVLQENLENGEKPNRCATQGSLFYSTLNQALVILARNLVYSSVSIQTRFVMSLLFRTKLMIIKTILSGSFK